ncbi:hypothetical protein SAMN05421771_1940 [Granulicella pectinivorans]|uniref:Uncharacterized protein n=1 Tax=Granulicella pectinivorans TaxID=474950 RepID=A0A1I6M6N6_9BACT|nr:hypothetical protein [Granulicella pectinivorans]SFS11278.1 hypothetical protein SAMN05421771_1940 [Granulicella pectinivorans]
MPAIHRLEARTTSHSLRLACLAANRTVAVVRSFAETLFDGNDFGGPSPMAVQA